MQAHAVSDVLHDVAAQVGIPTVPDEVSAPQEEPAELDHGARTLIDPSLTPEDELDAYRDEAHPVTASNVVTEAALTRPSQPVPMTGMIPQVPNSQAAQRYGLDTASAAVPKTGPVSAATTAVPLVGRNVRGARGRGTGGRWGTRHLRSFVRTEEAAPDAPRGAARIAQRQFVPTIRTQEHERREAFRREKEYARDTLNFTLRLAEAMFHYGADAMDVDSAIIAVSSAYGLDSVDVDITNQSVTINYTSDPDIYMESRIAKRNANADERFTHTLVRVVRSSTENYEALSEVYGLIYKITRGGMTLEIADLKLSQITHRPKPAAGRVAGKPGLRRDADRGAGCELLHGSERGHHLYSGVLADSVAKLNRYPGVLPNGSQRGPDDLPGDLAGWRWFDSAASGGTDFGTPGGCSGHDYVFANPPPGGCRARRD